MYPTFVDMAAVFFSFALLFIAYHAILLYKITTLFMRPLLALLAWITVLACLDYFLGVGLAIYKFFTVDGANLGAALKVFFLLLLTGLLLRIYILPPPKLELDEMKNFIKESLLFGNYFRKRDAETRAEIERHLIKKIYRETSHKELTDDVTSTAFDEQMVTFKKVGTEGLGKKKQYFPPTYDDDSVSLKQGLTTNVTSAFCFELARIYSHTFLHWMHNFSISPSEKKLSYDIIIPDNKPFDISTDVKKNLLVERVYESTQHLISQEWFLLYEKYINEISVTVKQTYLDEYAHPYFITILTFGVQRSALKQRSTLITPVSEIQKNCIIVFTERDI